jgi:phospholipid/cholesterol/gamma-HCH transport system permease protein
MNQFAVERLEQHLLLIRLAGRWQLGAGGSTADARVLEEELRGFPSVSRVFFDAGTLSGWDTSILTFVARVTELCRRRHVSIDLDGLPSGMRRLLELAQAVPEREGARRELKQTSLLERVGVGAIGAVGAVSEMLSFLGEMTVTFLRLLRSKARFRKSDLVLLIQQCGAGALPIVTLISALLGVILAFVGAVQLKRFGAQIYVADLVGIAMVREIAPLMTAILMAGRTGAAYAAQLGTMKVTQEIDAFTTSGFSPLEFLVLPRVLALFLMMPLLCLYADFIGILGGAIIGTGMLGLSWTTYIEETANAVSLGDMVGGLFKGAVYGLLVALAGCLRGLQSGRSSSAVGDAATSAVVTGIVCIIVACSIFALVFYLLGI